MYIIGGATNQPIICKLLLITWFVINSFLLYSQNLVEQYPVFKPGEKITYKAVYNWGFIWLNAGVVEFNVNETIYNHQSAYHFSSSGVSIPSYDWLFKVRDYFQSYTNTDNLTPFYFDRNTYEGGYKVYNRYTFNYDDKLIYSKLENSNRPYTEDTLKLQKEVYDVISGVYYIRNIDFDKYDVNDTIPIRMIIDNEIFDLYIRYLGKEVLTTHDNRIFKTIKFSALLIEGTIFNGGEDLYVWVTDDLNRIPVLVEAKILIGSVKATLDQTFNLKFPLSSEIIQ